MRVVIDTNVDGQSPKGFYMAETRRRLRLIFTSRPVAYNNFLPAFQAPPTSSPTTR